MEQTVDVLLNFTIYRKSFHSRPPARFISYFITESACGYAFRWIRRYQYAKILIFTQSMFCCV